MNRRRFLVATASAALSGVASGATAMARTYVFVPGAWHGAWCWERVTAPLQQTGHRSFPVELTGLGARAAELAPTITLDTHVADVVAVIEQNGLEDVILVGHSYGGVVVTGVVERVAARLRHLVYLDAVVLRDGESWSLRQPPAERARRIELGRKHHDAWPVPPAAVFGITDPGDQAWVQAHLTPQPLGPYLGVVHVGEPWRKLPRTFIDCSKPAMAAIGPYKAQVKRELGWRYTVLPTGHDAMVTAPAELASILAGIA